jgi:hypothetical protein
MNAYGAWAAESGLDTGYRVVKDADELRATGEYPVMTPEQCIALVEELGPSAPLVFHPLCGGMDPDLSWESLRLFESDVLPALNG